MNLPDFEDMLKVIEQIKKLSLEESRLEIRIKNRESEITREASTDTKWFTNGKAPSQTYIDNAWKYSGFDGELIPMREQLSEISSELGFNKNYLDFMKLLVDVWRTEESSKRQANI